jgi:hypothetical protein
MKRADGLYRVSEGDETAIAADGTFALVALASGALLGLVGYLSSRPGRLAPLAALVVGGALGAVVAWRTGVWLGPGALEESAATLRVGSRFDGPLNVSAPGVLLAWPIGVVLTYFAAAAGTEPAPTEGEGQDVVTGDAAEPWSRR